MGRPKKGTTASNEKEAVMTITEKKRRTSNGTGTASLTKNLNAPPDEVSAAIAKAAEAMSMPTVQSDEECRQRISDYFQWCVEHASVPLWEELALYLGIVRETLWRWSQGIGCSAERRNMVKKAKEALATIDAGLAAKGKIQPVVYIFRAKNFFDMKDQNEVVLTPNNPLGEQVDQKALEAKIADVVIDAE